MALHSTAKQSKALHSMGASKQVFSGERKRQDL